LALTQFENLVVASDGFYFADKAVENLQNLTENDFGYRRDDSRKERSAAIQKAQEWWKVEGRKEYTFDYIEAMMDEAPNKGAEAPSDSRE